MVRVQSALPMGRVGVTNERCVALHARTSKVSPPMILIAALLAFVPKPMPAHQGCLFFMDYTNTVIMVRSVPQDLGCLMALR